MTYTGRFAPSPTGPLHIGSLMAAVGSYLEARAQGGRWLLRMEDLDPPREAPGAAAGILRDLEMLGFQWDGPVVYQSQRRDAYEAALAQLGPEVFPCACSRSEIADSAVTGIEGLVYPGTCRDGVSPGKTVRALRVRVPSGDISFEDGLQGPLRQDLARDIGDFVVRRADGCHAYQLAVVVDDAAQGVSHVVRGADLLHSTPRQLHLQTLLELPHPVYAHLPIAVNGHGEKLSKQTGARPLDLSQPASALWQALTLLQQSPPQSLKASSIDDIWTWATQHWQPSSMNGLASVEPV